MPIGPIDPTDVINRIKQGASWQDYRVRFADQLHFLVITNGEWAFSLTSGHKISSGTFSLLVEARTNTNGTFTSGGTNYVLVSTTDSSGQQWASAQTI